MSSIPSGTALVAPAYPAVRFHILAIMSVSTALTTALSASEESPTRTPCASICVISCALSAKPAW